MVVRREQDGHACNDCQTPNYETSLLLQEAKVLSDHQVLVGNIYSLVGQDHNSHVCSLELAAERG